MLLSTTQKFMLLLAIVVITGAMATPGYADRNRRNGGMFKAMDADQDGVISQSEHSAWGQKKFQEIDANSDGKISTDERKAYQKARYKQRLEQRLQRLQDD